MQMQSFTKINKEKNKAEVIGPELKNATERNQTEGNIHSGILSNRKERAVNERKHNESTNCNTNKNYKQLNKTRIPSETSEIKLRSDL